MYCITEEVNIDNFISKNIVKLPHGLRNYFLYSCKKLKSHPKEEVVLFMNEIESLIHSVNFKLTSTDDEVTFLANRLAKKITLFIKKSANTNIKLIVDFIKSILNKNGIEMPNAKNIFSNLLRTNDPLWLRRKLRKRLSVVIEKIALKLNIIHKNLNIYASNICVKNKVKQIGDRKKLLAKLTAENEDGDSFSLKEISDKSVSNYKIQRTELMARINGNEIIADSLGHIGLFLTMSCPSRMHRCYEKTGTPNPKYDKTSPKEANNYLCLIMSHIRKTLKYKKIKFYGIRISEAHHDGTPHWHLLVFVSKNDSKTLLQVFKKNALKTDKNEEGAQKHRFKVVYIDKNIGSATNYITKFISKNIDAHCIDKDLYQHDAKKSALRIKAWASLWNIRQFQFYGNPPVSIWRELRRIEKSTNSKTQSAINAARKGDWAKYIKIMGGPCSKKEEQSISLLKKYSDEENKYREPEGYKVIGVISDAQQTITRVHKWKIRSISTIKEKIYDTWKIINNCTNSLFNRNKGTLKKSFGNSLTN